MLDFSNLNNNLEGATLSQVIIIALVCFVMSSIIALVYQKTSREIETPKYFIQSLILISIPVATVMQAIGDSLARGLGMLGALAIIRFRTTLRNPRNMVFMFTSIAIGIAAGTYGISIAIVGTIAFCTVVLLIYASPLSKATYYVGRIQFNVTKDMLAESNVEAEINALLSKKTIKTSLSRYTVNNRVKEESNRDRMAFDYSIKVETKDVAIAMADQLSKMKGVSNVKVNFKDDYEKI